MIQNLLKISVRLCVWINYIGHDKKTLTWTFLHKIYCSITMITHIEIAVLNNFYDRNLHGTWVIANSIKISKMHTQKCVIFIRTPSIWCTDSLGWIYYKLIYAADLFGLIHLTQMTLNKTFGLLSISVAKILFSWALILDSIAVKRFLPSLIRWLIWAVTLFDNHLL